MQLEDFLNATGLFELPTKGCSLQIYSLLSITVIISVLPSSYLNTLPISPIFTVYFIMYKPNVIK